MSKVGDKPLLEYALPNPELPAAKAINVGINTVVTAPAAGGVALENPIDDALFCR